MEAKSTSEALAQLAGRLIQLVDVLAEQVELVEHQPVHVPRMQAEVVGQPGQVLQALGCEVFAGDSRAEGGSGASATSNWKSF
ncbi:hypothetical protein GCM10022419_033930 [Nonomuraea rosea]|uniref:Uncharacterized protein n=1 Tax=Nonomuraea rosea TaxID=638574 RepID=A0ABP6WJV3_9ACTN